MKLFFVCNDNAKLFNFNSDTLDEQDAVETSAVQGRLTELQQARRDFVMAVANVGANAVNIEEESPPPSLLSPGMSETPQRHLLK